MKIYHAIFHPAEEGGFCVFFPDVPGAITQGDTIEEAVFMAADALTMILDCGRKGRDYQTPSSYEAICAQAQPGELVFPIMPDVRLLALNWPKFRTTLRPHRTRLRIRKTRRHYCCPKRKTADTNEEKAR